VTKINRNAPIDIDSMITLQIARPQVSVSDLIEIVNYAYEGAVTDYWEVEVLSTKKATLTIGGTEHQYTYAFTILDQSETEEGREIEINVDTVRRGIEKILNGEIQINDSIRQDIHDNVMSMSLPEIDHHAVDCVIQAGMFGELVYG
jgi:hypothetical protein